MAGAPTLARVNRRLRRFAIAVLSRRARQTAPRSANWRVSRLAVAILVVASVNLSAMQAVQAGVDSELNNFFNDLGGAGNAGGPAAYAGQSAGYFTGGGLWTRFPQRSVNPVNLQLPSIKAGCGGIDVFGGSFSFINGDEFIAMLKGVASNALGFAFQLAIKSISPQIASTIEELSQKIQQMNQFNMNSCEMAQGLVGGLWGKNQGKDSEICKAIANSQGWATDWAKSRQGCNAAGDRTAINASNKDDTIPAGPRNYTWHALNKSYPSFDRQFKEYLMTLVGTVIYVPPESDTAKPTYRYIGSADRSVITALISGTATKIQVCDTTDKCLSPTEQTITVGAATALKPKIMGLLRGMMASVQSDSALTPEQIGLLGGTTIPLYKVLTVNAASQFGGMAPAEIENLAELVAVDMVETIVREYYGLVNRASATFHDADEETLSQWRTQMQGVSGELSRLSGELGGRMQRTQTVLDRTIYLERTIRNSVSPQMAASMGFARGLSSASAQ